MRQRNAYEDVANLVVKDCEIFLVALNDLRGEGIDGLFHELAEDGVIYN